MPGLSKTTLARKVYNNPSIVNYFDVKAWCAVSQAYNRRTLLVEIFKQATSDESEMVSGMRINRDIEYCSLHDVVREFCLRKLTEDKYMQLAVPYNMHQHLHSTESRLCIYIHDDLVKQLDHSDNQLDKIPMLDSKETNSLEFIAHPKLNTWNKRYSNPLHLLVKLRFIRPLHLMDVELPNSWATAMQSVTQLRYLSLYVKQFEKWILHLHDLQTLQLKSSKRIRLRAATLWEMTKLRHVNIDCFSLVWEENEEGSFEESSTTMLENMKTFCTSDMLWDDMNPRLWRRFPNLEELSLPIKYVPESPLFPIPEVHNRLHSLSVELCSINFCNSVGWERYFVFPPNLRHLNLVGYFLTEGMDSNIARLKELESLTLAMGFPFRSQNSCWDVTNVVFPSLKYLTLYSVMMNEWKASEESFPVLEELYLVSCFLFKEIPPSFVDIPTLRLIKLSRCMIHLGFQL